MKDFIEKIARLHDFIENDLAHIVGKESVDFYKESFDNEGFIGENLEKWKEVKRRQNPRNKGRAAGTRKILTGETKELAESIGYKAEGRKVKISSDKVYAEIHNKGGRAGRGHKSVIHARPFIKKSASLIKRLNRRLKRKIQNL
jgi:phage gpG-like protein